MGIDANEKLNIPGVKAMERSERWTVEFFAGQFKRPMGVSFAGDKRLVADTGNGRVSILDERGKVIKTINKIGVRELMYPVAVAALDENTFVVSDIKRGEVVAASFDGKERFTMPMPGDKTRVGSVRPTGVTVGLNRIFVTDVERNRILIFDRGGKYIRSFGKPGNKPGELSYPNGVAVDNSAKRIYVADSNNRRIQVFNIEGDFIKILDLHDLKPLITRGVTVDSVNHNLYFADTLDHKVFKYNLITEKISLVNKETPLRFPNAVTADGKGNLLAADRENNRVVLFKGFNK